MKIIHTAAALALVSLTAACVAPDSYPPPAPMQLSAVLTGSQEVPPTASPGSGAANVQYDSASQRMSWTITYGNLTGPLQAATIQGPAPTGLNGAVQVPIPAQFSPLAGSAYLTQAQANDLMAGRMYVNLHTPAFPNGEIRGQIVRGVAAVPPAVAPAPVVTAPAPATTTTTTTTTTGGPVVIAPAPAPVVVAPAPPGQVISSVRNADGSTTVTTRNADGSFTYTTYR